MRYIEWKNMIKYNNIYEKLKSTIAVFYLSEVNMNSFSLSSLW